LGAHVIRVHGPHARRQGLVHGHARADPYWYAPFGDSARHWYRDYAEQVLFLNHVLINPPIDRDKAVHEVEDVYVHVIRERDDADAVVIFDNAFIPWDNVLVYRDVKKATGFYAQSGSCRATRSSPARGSRSSSTSCPC
jgi:aromatic ring hydroxylase